ncbi:MAG: hypothetical protein U0234_17910 [Sandaracinus sp.]
MGEPEQLWWLTTCRHALAMLAPRTSASLFWWTKEPGNGYTTFYPTRILPPQHSALRGDAGEGARLMAAVVRPSGAAMRLTIGTYGDDQYSIPRWDGGDDVARIGRGEDPSAAATKLCAMLNVEWLSAQSPADPATTDIVLAWIDRVLDVARATPNAELSMDFERNQLPMALWMISVRDPATGMRTDIWWGDREDLEWKY